MSDCLPQEAELFDAEWRLDELLARVDRAAMVESLARLAGGAVRLCDAKGQTLAGAEGGSLRSRAPVRGELEPVGWLEGDGEPLQLAAAARLIELLLRSEMRYRMASRLHLATVQADYDALREKHAALLESEARYRALALQLEQRVQQQVQTIQATQRQLYESEKMAAVGQLAAGMAHEINTPLGFIRSNLNTALDYREELAGPQLAEDKRAWILDDLNQLLHENIDGVDRIARIVTALKAFSRVDRDLFEPVDLNTIVLDAIEVVRPQAGAGVRFEHTLATLPPLRCQPGALGQVFYNLLLNAAQALDGEGRVMIASRLDGDGVRVSVADTGRGIPSANLSRIFEPFFTTREVGQGTGLGLTVSHDIVKGHGGRIEVQSTPGKGSVFHVHLPFQGAP